MSIRDAYWEFSGTRENTSRDTIIAAIENTLQLSVRGSIYTGTMNKTKRRQWWMSEFERFVVDHNPALAGKVDWDTAAHLFNLGLSARDAAARVSFKTKESE